MGSETGFHRHHRPPVPAAAPGRLASRRPRPAGTKPAFAAASRHGILLIPSRLPAAIPVPTLITALGTALFPVAASALLLAAVPFLGGCAPRGGPPGGAPSHGPGAAGPPLVVTAKVARRDINTPAEYVGHVEAVQAVDLRARVQGFLEKVAFEEGTAVREGDLLYLIEQAPYQAEVDADRAAVAGAEAALTRAEQYLKRVRSVKPGVVSATDIDDAVAAELEAKAKLAAAKAALERSELDLKYTTVTAPITGRIGRTAFTKGNLVGPESGPLSRIVQMDPIRVVFSVSENDLAAVLEAFSGSAGGGEKEGGEEQNPFVPRIRLPGGKILDKPGRMDFADNTVDASTGTIAVRALFDNPGGLLVPGRYVTVLLSRGKPRVLPVVPQAAVQEDREGRFVFVVDGKNTVAARRIETGPLVGTEWAVESGLEPGERVIVQGVQKVRPGMVVKTAGAGGRGGA